jgi:hypothetical protein
MSSGKCSQHELSGVPWSGHHEAVEYREWVLRMQYLRSEVHNMSETTLNLNVNALQKLAGYAHWIPMLRGYHEEFLSKNYPGWEWNDILPVLIKKGIVKRYSSDPDQRKLSHDLSISHEIESLTISRTTVGKKVVIQTSCVKTKLRRVK